MKLEWFCETEHWPVGHYSQLEFSLKKIKDGTELTMTHKNVPEACYEDISQGWEEYYWKPMKKMLEKK